MAEMMTCPVCGKEFEVVEYQILDNGNPACPECVQKEQDNSNE